jgi:hypothetical protein
MDSRSIFDRGHLLTVIMVVEWSERKDIPCEDIQVNPVVCPSAGDHIIYEKCLRSSVEVRQELQRATFILGYYAGHAHGNVHGS